MSFLKLQIRAILAAVVLVASGLTLVLAISFRQAPDPSTVPSEIRAEEVDALVRRAVSDVERNDVEAAQRRIAEALRANPNHAKALLYAGQFARDRRDSAAALAMWNRIPDGAGQSAATARFLEASLRIELRQARAAERLLRRAIELNPRYVAAHERLLRLYVAQMRSDEIRSELAAIEQLRPLTLDELVLEIVADERVLSVEEGIAVTRGFVREDGDDVTSRLALAQYLSKDQPGEAKEVLTDFLATHAQNEQVRALLASLYIDEGDISAAKHLFEDRQPTDDSSTSMWLVFARLQEAAGDWNGAGEAYVEVLRRRANDGSVRYLAGQLLQRLG
jgi:Tfp pilus assembly protein PilF